MTIADLIIKITADTDKASRDLEKVGKKGSSSLGKLGKIAGRTALGLGATAGVGLAWAAKVGFDEFTEGERVSAQTAAALKSTGGAAHVTADHISDLAGAIMRKSGMDDEAVQSGENLLLTFTNVRNEVGRGNDIFDQATNIMADMSVALGQDTSSSAIQLGKALNDPIKGVTALQRVGVSFTQAQRDQIRSMVESGNTMGAQKLILAELTKEFGGSAEAAGKTFSGQINIAKQVMSNFAGDMVAKAIPAIQTTIAWLRDHWPEITAKIQEFWATARPPLQAFIDMVVQIYTTVRDNWDKIGPIVRLVADIIKAQVRVITNALRLVTALLRGDWSAAWNALRGMMSAVWDSIVARLNLAKTVLLTIARAIGNGIKNAIVGGVTGVASGVWDIVSNIGAVLESKAGAVAGWGAKLGGRLKNAIIGALTGIGEAIANQVRNAVNSVIDRLNSILEFTVNPPGPGPKFHFNPPDVPHLSRGTDLVQTDGMAFLHRGEAVVPAEVAGGGFSGRRGVTIEGDLIIREEIDVDRALARIGRRLAVA